MIKPTRWPALLGTMLTVACLFSTPLSITQAQAQSPVPADSSNYPSRAINWIVAYAPGAASDIMTRMLAQAMGEELGQSVVVENIPGGGSTIGAARAAREKADGYTIITLDTAGLAINPHLMDKLNYHPENSFSPVSMVSRIPFVLVTNAASGPADLQEFMELARQDPGALTYGSAGPGSAIHMAMALLEQQADLELTHVPYKGASPALTDVLAGRVDALFISLGAAKPHLDAGTLRALGASGSQRFAASPEIPTVAEAGVPGYEASSWQAVLGPVGMDEAVVAKLNAALQNVLNQAEIQDRLQVMGIQPEGSTPVELGNYIAEESAKWSQLITEQDLRNAN